jgi:Ulp1 family protease
LFKIANGTYTEKELKKCLPAWGPTVDGMLILPFNPGSCHWALTVVHWKLGSIQHFDDLNCTPVESLKENPMVSQVKSLLNKTFPLRQFDFDESYPNLPQQKDSYSCGVSCKFFVLLL